MSPLILCWFLQAVPLCYKLFAYFSRVHSESQLVPPYTVKGFDVGEFPNLAKEDQGFRLT
ncbi:hypothetical protein M758_UG039700 [Ceratodon purpureus]|nr:hypothetical protein M758_UG039700 [Ceratodon purpureus]